jgi:putative ABC transport system substrate-binding protein
MVEERAGALLMAPDPFLSNRSAQLAALTVRHSMPAMFARREGAAAGGLASYSSDDASARRVAGSYVGRILKGEKPGDVPVQQSTKVDLVLNLKTAKALGITVPLPLLGLADEVIE